MCVCMCVFVSVHWSIFVLRFKWIIMQLRAETSPCPGSPGPPYIAASWGCAHPINHKYLNYYNWNVIMSEIKIPTVDASKITTTKDIIYHTPPSKHTHRWTFVLLRPLLAFIISFCSCCYFPFDLLYAFNTTIRTKTRTRRMTIIINIIAVIIRIILSTRRPTPTHPHHVARF